MCWVKLDDQFTDNKKVAGLSDSAFRLCVTALCYTAGQLTDGFIPSTVLKRIGWASKDVENDVAQLVFSNLWEEVEDGYYIHDYLEYNPSGEQVKAEREAASKRMKKLRGGAARSGEVRAKFGRSSGTPVPVPVPVPVPIPDEILQGEKPERSEAQRRNDAMMEALAKVCKKDIKLSASMIAKTSVSLLKAGYTPEQVEMFYGENGWWYIKDWRGKKGQAPTLSQVADTIKEAVDNFICEDYSVQNYIKKNQW